MKLAQIAGGLVGAAFGLKAFDGEKPLWARIAYGAVAFDLITNSVQNKPLLGLKDGAIPAGKGPASGPVRLDFKERRVRSIQDRVAQVHVQMIASTRDPKVYALAREAVAQKCGEEWCLPAGTILLTSLGELPIEQVTPGMEVMGDGGWTKVLSWFDMGKKPLLEIELNNGLVLRCTEDHKLFKVPPRAGGRSGLRGSEVEVRAGKVRVGDDLLQPDRLPSGTVSLSHDEAIIMGAYVAEGWLEPSRVSIAGVVASKGIREQVLGAAQRLGIPTSEDAFKVRLMDPGLVERLRASCGELAVNKHLPHTNFDEATTRVLLSMLEADARSPDRSKVKTATFFTTSPVLARQYRTMYRQLGQSCSVKVIPGKAATHQPVFQVHVRQTNVGKGRKYWAKVKAVRRAEAEHTFDIETESRRFYLPDSDVVVHNCVPEKDHVAEATAIYDTVRARVRYVWDPTDYDAFQSAVKTLALKSGDCDDYCILLGALLRSLGHKVRSRIVQTKESDTWNHIYLLVQVQGWRNHPKNPNKGSPSATDWMPLDASVKKFAGWEVPDNMVTRKQDFDVVESGATPQLTK